MFPPIKARELSYSGPSTLWFAILTDLSHVHQRKPASRKKSVTRWAAR